MRRLCHFQLKIVRQNYSVSIDLRCDISLLLLCRQYSYFHVILIKLDIDRDEDLNATACVEWVLSLETEFVGHDGARFVIFWEDLHVLQTAWRRCIRKPVDLANPVIARPVVNRNRERLRLLDIVRIAKL